MLADNIAGRYKEFRNSFGYGAKAILKGGIVLLLLSSVLGYFFVLQPVKADILKLEKEKNYWENVIMQPLDRDAYTIPDIVQLPNIIERCKLDFLNKGGVVAGLSVERIGEKPGDAKQGLNYAVVRFHLRGEWDNLLQALSSLEGREDFVAEVQEMSLSPMGGEAVLKLYFRS